MNHPKLKTGIDTIVVTYPTTLVTDDERLSSESLFSNNAKWKKGKYGKWLLESTQGWTATITGTHWERRISVRLDSSIGKNNLDYVPPMTPEEIKRRLGNACDVLGVPGGAPEWWNGTVQRVDFTVDQRLAKSPAPETIPRFDREMYYPDGGALFLSKRRKKGKLSARSVIFYHKNELLSIWRTEFRFTRRSACRRSGLSGVEDALTKYLFFKTLIDSKVKPEVIPTLLGIPNTLLFRGCAELTEVRRRIQAINIFLKKLDNTLSTRAQRNKVLDLCISEDIEKKNLTAYRENKAIRKRISKRKKKCRALKAKNVFELFYEEEKKLEPKPIIEGIIIIPRSSSIFGPRGPPEKEKEQN